MEICQIFRACGALKNHCFLAFLHCKTPIFFACGELKMMIFLLKKHYVLYFFRLRRATLGIYALHFWKFSHAAGWTVFHIFCKRLQTCFGILQAFCKFALVFCKLTLIFCKLFTNLFWYFCKILQICFGILQAVCKLLQKQPARRRRKNLAF